MLETVRQAVKETTARLREHYIASQLAAWEAATTGTPEALEKSAQERASWMRFWADPEAYARYKAWDEADTAADDPLLARTVRVLRLQYAAGQRDPQTIEAMSALMKDLDDAYTNFRAEVDGKRLSANDFAEILRTENRSERRRAAWEGSKGIGPRVADQIRRLAELRNDAAHRMGYANFHRMSLELDELDPDWLYATLDDLAQKTEAPYRAAKAELDAALSARFGVPADELMPWHYADTFFQKAPVIGDFDFDAIFEGRDLVELALRTYDGLGMEVRDILERSDLYEREGKDQHAFCIHIDLEGDVRVLCNLKPSLRWAETILHELGHAVYDKYIPQSLPWLLRTPPHILSTEAMALLMGARTLDAEWHVQVLGTPESEAERVTEAGFAHERLDELIFARWVMVVVNFERLLYEDPSRDLNRTWWELVARYQLLNVPAGREALPDWATKYHIALAPAYYQNYLLGHIMALQWEAWLREHVGGFVGKQDAGDFFRERIFAPGNSQHWEDALERATGERLKPDYFVQRYAR